MKAIKIILIAVVFMIMMILTAIPYIGDSPSLAGGSIGSIIIMITTHVVISTALLVAFVLISYFYVKNKVKSVFFDNNFFIVVSKRAHDWYTARWKIKYRMGFIWKQAELIYVITKLIVKLLWLNRQRYKNCFFGE